MNDIIKSLRAQHDELGRRIEALEKRQDGEWPQVGDTFFYILPGGSIHYGCWRGGFPHHNYLAAGNCYRTEAEAKRGHLAATAMRLLRKWADEDKAANSDLVPYYCYRPSDPYHRLGPAFATSTARDRAQVTLTKEQLEALV